MITLEFAEFVNDPLSRFMFPFPELWEGTALLLTILVALRIILYSIAAKEDDGHFHFRIGSPLLYLLVFMFFGMWGLFFVVLLHFGRLHEWKILKWTDNFAKFIPRKVEDISVFVITVWMLLIFQLLPQSISSSLNKLPTLFDFLPTIAWATLFLLLYIFVNVRKGKSQRLKHDLGLSVLFFLGFVLFVGVDGLYIYLIIVAVSPFFTRAESIEGGDWEGYYVQEEKELRKFSSEQRGSMNVLGNLMASAVSGLSKVTSNSISKLAQTLGEKIGVNRNERNSDFPTIPKDAKVQSSIGILWLLVILGDVIFDWIVLPKPSLLSILIDVALGGLLIWQLSKYSKLNTILISILVLLEIFGYGYLPLFVIYLIFAPMLSFLHLTPQGSLGKSVLVGLVFLLVIFGAPLFNLDMGQAIASSRQSVQEYGISDITNPFVNLKDRIGDTVNEAKKQFKIATLPYYATQVEDDENSKDIGLDLKINPSGSQQFYEGVPGRISAQLEGELTRDLMRECFKDSSLEKCQVKTSCSLDGQGPASTGQDNTFSFTEIGSRKTIICDFVPLSSAKLNIGTEFDFETKARASFYGMDSDTYNTLSGVEGLRDRQIIERYGYNYPVSKRTPGPVELGIGVDNFIVRIPREDKDNPSKSRDYLPTSFGFTLYAKDGKITDINDVTIYVPKGFKLDTSSCNYPFSFEESPDLSKDGEKVYKLFRPVSSYDISEFLTVNCLLYPDAFEETLSPGLPISDTQWLVVSVNTKNVIERSTYVTVKSRSESSDFQTIPSLDVCPKRVNVCSDYPSKSWCDNDPCLLNCVYNYGLLDIGSSCESCPSGAKCSDYINNAYCNLDPCNMGCSWINNECINVGIEDNFGWVSQRTREVHGCDSNDKNRLIVSDFDRELKSPASGTILTGSADSLTIDHGDGYKSTFFQLKSVRRAKGNVMKGETIGFAKRETMFEITKSGVTIDLFGFYKNKQKPIIITSKDPSCMETSEVPQS